MNKLLSALKSIKPSKTVIWVGGAVTLFLLILGAGIAQNVRAERATTEHNATIVAEAKADKATIEALKARNAVLEADSKKLQGESQTVAVSCAEFRRLDAIRAITGSVVVPAFCTGR
jgi:cell division protein FtsB